MLIEQQIFRLDIPMHNPQLAQISQSRNKLLEKLASFFFLQLVFRRDETEQLTIAAVLHDEK